MTLLLSLMNPLERFNRLVGWIGSYLSILALALMVLIILLQVFRRYVMNNALPWPDEAARFFDVVAHRSHGTCWNDRVLVIEHLR